jgi:hypothetical protein
MARNFGTCSPMTMCRVEMRMKATVVAMAWATGSAKTPSRLRGPMSRLAMTGSPIHPRASEAKVIPTCTAER